MKTAKKIMDGYLLFMKEQHPALNIEWTIPEYLKTNYVPKIEEFAQQLPSKERIIEVLNKELKIAWMKGADYETVGFPDYDRAYTPKIVENIANKLIASELSADADVRNEPNRQNYHLNCDKCGTPYWSQEAFPKHQLCFKCDESKSISLPTDEEIDIKIKKDDFDDIFLDTYRFYDWCKGHKIKIEEPKSKDGLYHTFVVTLKTPKEKMLFQSKWYNKLSKYLSQAKAIDLEEELRKAFEAGQEYGYLERTTIDNRIYYSIADNRVSNCNLLSKI
jgi:hypothetical protein